MLAKMLTLTALALATILGPVSSARGDTHSNLTVAGLKHYYLGCERLALTRQISSEEIKQCSVIYEELKQRAFGGDWNLLREWTERNLGSGAET